MRLHAATGLVFFAIISGTIFLLLTIGSYYLGLSMGWDVLPTSVVFFMGR